MTEQAITTARERERAEQSVGAAARAIAEHPELRYRRHMLHLGRQLARARAPHVHLDEETTRLADLRGSSDGIALRVRLSDPTVYAMHAPDGGIAELIYECLEQFRVEALAPASLPGIRTNLELRFEAWTNELMENGVLENDLGLLVFAVIQVSRSRILRTPMPERLSDHLEATRAGIYPVIGKGVRELPHLIHDQSSFDELAAQLAIDVEALAHDSNTNTRPRKASASMLALLDLDQHEHESHDTEFTQGTDHHRKAERSEYEVFTSEFDETSDISKKTYPHTLAALRSELDALESTHRAVAGYLNRTVERLFPAPIDEAWESEQEVGFLDPRLLTKLATPNADPRIFRTATPVMAPEAVVTILVDCSGSMKGVAEPVAVLIDLLVRALDRVQVTTEVLGFTTGAWNGGRARELWHESGRPTTPGRLNEVSHIVFKDADMTWRQARRGIAGLLWKPMFRESVDGEAVEWAYRRLMARPEPKRCLIVVADGSPMDGATLLTNGETYLDRHLIGVCEAIEGDRRVRLFGLGIGHDMSSYISDSRYVDPGAIATRDVAASIMEFLEQV